MSKHQILSFILSWAIVHAPLAWASPGLPATLRPHRRAEQEAETAEEKARRNQEAWTLVWSAGKPTALGEEYHPAINEFWRQYFEDRARANPRAKVLDIATGNLAIPRIARTISQTLELHAIDTAVIPIEKLPWSRGIRFWQRPAEDTQFPDEFFDVVTGMYALEYTPRDRTLRELYRVLRPNGSICLLIHHPDSVIARGLRKALDEHTVMDRSGLFESLQRYVSSGSKRDRETVQAALRRLEAMIRDRLAQGLSRQFVNEFDEALTLAGIILSPLVAGTLREDPEARRAVRDELDRAIRNRQELIGHRRMVLNDVAIIGDDQRPALLSLVTSHGFVVDRLEQFRPGGSLYGWLLQMHKATAPATPDLPLRGTSSSDLQLLFSVGALWMQGFRGPPKKVQEIDLAKGQVRFEGERLWVSIGLLDIVRVAPLGAPSPLPRREPAAALAEAL